MKVLLFWPCIDRSFALGLPLIQSIIKQSGHQVKYITTEGFHPDPFNKRGNLFIKYDYSLTDSSYKAFQKQLEEGGKYFLKEVDDFNPDIILMSAFSTNFLLGLEYYRKIKKKVFLLVGGVHPTVAPDDAISYPEVDAICVGEGEPMVGEFINKFASGSLESRDFSGISNIWYKNSSGEVIKNDLGAIADMDSLILPDFTGFSLSVKYVAGIPHRAMQTELSRGCPLSCTYCCNDGIKKAFFAGKRPKIRRMTPENAVNKIKILAKKYNVQLIRFFDENLLISPLPWITKLCELYKKEINLPFTLSASVETLNETRIKLVKDSGCININFGPESGNWEYRKKFLKKKASDKQYIDAANLLRKYKLRGNVNFVVGMEGQNKEILMDSIDLLRKIKLSSAPRFFVPLPGSEMYNNLYSKGEYGGFKSAYDNYRSFADPVYIPEGLSRKYLLEYLRTMVLFGNLPKTLWPIIHICKKENIVTNKIIDVLDKLFAY
tara:strand:+ start:480 stop:1955 length:1476 start_codon:yes stop_codon:yes gene_type:complete